MLFLGLHTDCIAIVHAPVGRAEILLIVALWTEPLLKSSCCESVHMQSKRMNCIKFVFGGKNLSKFSF